jgi:glucose-6-phosphate 1-epimerase
VAENPCARVVRTSDDGAKVEGCAHGGHLTGWWPVGAHESRLWMSSASGCGPGIAIRGGIPVVFPQFGALGELPKHGFARDRAWRRLEPPRSHNASMGFATTIESEPGWPHRAGLQMSATARGDRLAVTLQVTNVGAEPFMFTAALHAYLAVGSTADTVIEGLSGLAGVDAAGGGRAVTLPDGPLRAAGPQDLMIREVPAPLTLRDPTRPDPVPLAADQTWAATLTMTATA